MENVEKKRQDRKDKKTKKKRSNFTKISKTNTKHKLQNKKHKHGISTLNRHKQDKIKIQDEEVCFSSS